MQRGSTHRFFDHTGDFGADLAAPTLEGVYEEAAHAWIDLLTDAPRAVGEAEERSIEVSGVDPADLLVSLGNELLYLFETEGWLAARIEIVSVDDGALDAKAFGEAYDPARHPIARPVKAVTHHGAMIERGEDGGWTGRLIFDL